MKKNILLSALAILLAFCFWGCSSEPEDTGNGNTGDGAWVLKITGIPSGTNILGAALLDDDDKPLYAAMNSSSSFTFYAYKDGATIPMDTSKPLKTAGEYYIALSTQTDGDGDNYLYCGDSESRSKYEFTGSTTTLKWSEFKKETP